MTDGSKDNINSPCRTPEYIFVEGKIIIFNWHWNKKTTKKMCHIYSPHSGSLLQCPLSIQNRTKMYKSTIWICSWGAAPDDHYSFWKKIRTHISSKQRYIYTFSCVVYYKISTGTANEGMSVEMLWETTSNKHWSMWPGLILVNRKHQSCNSSCRTAEEIKQFTIDTGVPFISIHITFVPPVK